MSHFSHYRAGFLDAFDGHGPAWLGIDPYRYGYEGGCRATEHPGKGYELLGTSPDGLERVYGVTVRNDGMARDVEVHVRFDRSELKWRASVPGYSGAGEISVWSAIMNLPSHVQARAGRWLSEGRALHGFGRNVVFLKRAA